MRIAIRTPSGMAETFYHFLGRHGAEPLAERKPSWLTVRAPGGETHTPLKHLMHGLDLISNMNS